MKEENVQQNSIFLKKFTLAILQTVEERKFNIRPETKDIIDADLVPALSNQLLHEYELNKRLIEKLQKVNAMNRGPSIKVLKVPRPQKSAPKPVMQSLEPVKDASTSHGFEKVQPLLADFSVSRIQCLAPNKPLLVVRTGQKQITKISLTPEEITDVFKGIADQAHLPLIEGPFKVSTKEYTINGINTRVANARFIIQKQTAYSLLEKKKQ